MTPVLTYFFWPVSWIPSCFPASPEEILLTPSLSVDPWLITFVPGAVFFKDLFFFSHPEKDNFCFFKLRVVYSFSHTQWFSGSNGAVFEKGTIVGEYVHSLLNRGSGKGRILNRSCRCFQKSGGLFCHLLRLGLSVHYPTRFIRSGLWVLLDLMNKNILGNTVGIKNATSLRLKKAIGNSYRCFLDYYYREHFHIFQTHKVFSYFPGKTLVIP